MALLSCWQLVRYTKSHDIHTLSGSCNLVSGLVHPRYRWTHPTYTTGLTGVMTYLLAAKISGWRNHWFTAHPCRLARPTRQRTFRIPAVEAGWSLLAFQPFERRMSLGIPLAQRYHLWYIYTEETAKCIAYIFSISYLFPIVPYLADLRYATKRTFVCLMDMTRSTSHMFPAICLFAGFVLQYQVYPLSLIYYSLF